MTKKTTYYHKLVRDNIPTIIEAKGKTCKWIILRDPESYTYWLYAKLKEEVAEFFKDPSMEEIGDIEDVLRAIITVQGWSPIEVEKKRNAKCLERGGFRKGIFLFTVTEEVKE